MQPIGTADLSGQISVDEKFRSLFQFYLMLFQRLI
jgi:hypothetical protein